MSDGERAAGGGPGFVELRQRFDVEGATVGGDGDVLGELAAELWSRPGLGRRLRRLVSLTCTAGSGDEAGFEAQVSDALRGKELSVDDLNEFTLHFAVYCGWPKGSLVNGVVLRQWAAICAEEGLEPPGAEEAPLWRPELSIEERAREERSASLRSTAACGRRRAHPSCTRGILSLSSARSGSGRS